MPSHPERVRRNYPEGVPQFGTHAITRCLACDYVLVPAEFDQRGWPLHYWCDSCRMMYRKDGSSAYPLEPVSSSEVPRPPLTATVPPADLQPQAAEPCPYCGAPSDIDNKGIYWHRSDPVCDGFVAHLERTRG